MAIGAATVMGTAPTAVMVTATTAVMATTPATVMAIMKEHTTQPLLHVASLSMIDMTLSMVLFTTVERCSCSHLFLCKHTCGHAYACLQERLKAQKAEAASNPEYGSTYKPQTSKEDRTAKRKQILSNIGLLPLHNLCQDAMMSMFDLLLGKHASASVRCALILCTRVAPPLSLPTQSASAGRSSRRCCVLSPA